MNELREAVIREVNSIEKLWKGLNMPMREAVTFGQLLDLIDIGRRCASRTVRVTLPDGHGVEGSTASGFWRPFEDHEVAEISVAHGVLLVWLRGGMIRMTRTELVAALRGMQAETGSLVCLGCGHEHNCSTKGCAIIRAAADMLEKGKENLPPEEPGGGMGRGSVDAEALPQGVL